MFKRGKISVCLYGLLGPSEVGGRDSTIGNGLHLGESGLDHLERRSRTDVTPDCCHLIFRFFFAATLLNRLLS